MSENQKKISETSQPENKKTPKKSHIKQHFFLFLLLLIIIAGAAIFYHYNQFSMSATDNATAALATVEATNARLEQQQLAIEELQQSMAKLSDKQVSVSEQINQMRDAMTTQPATVPVTTQLATQRYELAYLLRMATLQLQFAQDLPAAQRLLTLADTQIQEMADPRLITVRKQIANAQLALKSFNAIDTDGVLSQLNAIATQVKNLPRQTAKSVPASDSTFTATTENPKWRQALNHSLDYLGKVVVIRHQEKPLEPLLNAEQQQLLEENIQLLLQRAGWAVVMHKPSVYELSLQQVISMIESYYQDTPKSKKLIAELNTLKAVDVQINVPDISAAWRTLQQIERQKPESTEQPTSMPSQKGE